MKLGSGAFEGPYSFSSRFEEAKRHEPGGTHRRGRGRLLLNGTVGKSGKGRTSGETNQHDRDRETGNGRRRSKDHDDRSENSKPMFRESTKQNFKNKPSSRKKTCPVSVVLAGTQINLDAKLIR